LALCICSLVVFVSSLGTDPQTNEHYECGTNIVLIGGDRTTQS